MSKRKHQLIKILPSIPLYRNLELVQLSAVAIARCTIHDFIIHPHLRFQLPQVVPQLLRRRLFVDTGTFFSRSFVLC